MASDERRAGWRSWLDQAFTIKPQEVDRFDPVREAAKRSKEVPQILQLLVAGRESRNEDLTSATALRLRKGYLLVTRTYASHDQRFNRGWGVPEWTRLTQVEPTVEAVRAASRFKLDTFIRRELPGIKYRVKFAAAVLEHYATAPATPEERRAIKPKVRELNRTFLLFEREAGLVRWAFDSEEGPPPW